MMRIVIADDEYLIQESLISMIEELSQDWEVVGVASDGRELSELIVSRQPDLAIVDIQMPYLSGFQAIQASREHCPLMKWIVLTGHSEFEYAKEALKLGASNYLLKPVDQAELASSLTEAELALHSLNEMENIRFGSRLTDLCYGLGSDHTAEEASSSRELDIRLYVFYVDSGLEEAVKSSRLSAFYKQLRDKVHRELQRQMKVRFALVFLPGGELALITSSPKMPDFNRIHERIDTELKQITQEASRGTDLSLTWIASACSSYPTLREQLNKLQRLSLLRICSGINRRWGLPALSKEWCEERMKLCKTVAKMTKYVEERSYALYVSAVHEFKEQLERMDPVGKAKVKAALSPYIQVTIGCQLPGGHSDAEWVKALQGYGQQLLTEQIPKGQRPLDIIQQTLLFIDTNYRNEISILQISEELQVTPNYLSTLFHKKMGTTFIKYVTHLRLTKARELLKEPNIQVQTVAAMVGYMNPRYFAGLFMDMFGCSPSDYKRSLENNR